MLLENKALLASNIFHRSTLNFRKIQIDVSTYSLMPGISNLVILEFLICSFHFWHCFKL